MNATLLRGLVALMPACVLLSGSIILFSKGLWALSYNYSVQEALS